MRAPSLVVDRKNLLTALLCYVNGMEMCYYRQGEMR